MKKILFTSTALAALAFGGVASAQGISLFGDARLGLGYNIGNDGYLLLEQQDDGSFDTEDDLRAISRVRFGVNMTGVTDSGITFGATIRADNSSNGQGGSLGQRAGNVFVSGDWGTLTFGDTDGADARYIGDLNEVGLTGLGEQNETPYLSNAGGFNAGEPDSGVLVANPQGRPTVRYDIDVAGFGLSLGSNRDLTDVQVGLGYDGQFGESTFSVGLGYNNFGEYDTGADFVNPDGTPGEDIFVDGGEQWSAGVGVGFSMFDAKLIYTKMEFDGGPEIDWAGIGLGTTFGEFGIDAYYAQIIDASGFDQADGVDGLQSYGVGVTYDLGGGARVEGGVASVMSMADQDDGFIVADFGIGMSF